MEFKRENHAREVSFDEFMEVSNVLAGFAKKLRRGVAMRILVCDDVIAYKYWRSGHEFPEADKLLDKRPSYSLEEFVERMWKEAQCVELRIWSDGDASEAFSIVCACDRSLSPKKIEVRTEGIPDDACDPIYGLLGFPDQDEAAYDPERSDLSETHVRLMSA